VERTAIISDSDIIGADDFIFSSIAH
jgi:hypothetical protein